MSAEQVSKTEGDRLNRNDETENRVRNLQTPRGEEKGAGSLFWSGNKGWQESLWLPLGRPHARMNGQAADARKTLAAAVLGHDLRAKKEIPHAWNGLSKDCVFRGARDSSRLDRLLRFHGKIWVCPFPCNGWNPCSSFSRTQRTG
jgi:hypothetical protein